MNAGDCITNYIQGKDHNRPHLLRSVFAEDAKLVMLVKTGAISFPPVVNGLDGITDVLVRRFGQTYENVYTFCLASPPSPDASAFSCDWLVGMSGKAEGEVRVGCGRYDWVFSPGPAPLVTRLTITIEEMVVLTPNELPQVMGWLSGLPSSWCDPEAAIQNLPNNKALDSIVSYCKQHHRSN
ncbi:MAG: hypothetical protein HEQ39_10440 [Rhizobacter sp.]